jgi:hypothetical protein
MRADFIITQKLVEGELKYVIVPTHTAALNWMFAHVAAGERRSTTAHLVDARFAQFKSDAAIENLTCSDLVGKQTA